MADADAGRLNAELVERSTRGQLEAADPEASVWVSANAGTGKTHTLTSRVARLLLKGTPPERILCLTFTRAAAAQMETKLFARLGKWSTMEQEKLEGDLFQLEGRHLSEAEIAQARRLFARALETPGGLKIQTIHAFCESLLGRFPLEAGVSPHFELADERTSAEMLREARDLVLEEAADNPDSELGRAFGFIVRQANEMALASLLHEIAGSRRRLMRLVDESGGLEGLDTRVSLALGVAPGRTLDDVTADALAAVDEAAVKQAVDVLSGGKSTDTKTADVLRTFLAGPHDAAAWDEYRLAFLTKGKLEARSRLMTKGLLEANPGVGTWLENEQARVLAVEVERRSVATAQATAAVMRFAWQVLNAYQAEKDARALLDYDDLIEKTGDLLTTKVETAWVLYKLDGGLDHILVDEAQDTSPEQWTVVKTLAEEFFTGASAREEAADVVRTLFAVGDEKQSIFSFQGAEPGTFAEMKAHFSTRANAAGLEWRNVDLTVSWRTVPGILDAVDQVFADAAAKRGVVADESSRVHHESVRVGHASLVELWPMVEPDETEDQAFWDRPLDAISPRSAEAKLAERITSEISRWVNQGEYLAQRNRPIEPGDILILVRRRGPFVDELIRQLKTAHIPVAGVDRMVLTEQLAVKDLMALAQFALLPGDDLTLATVLKGPLCGVSEDELFHLAHGREGTLWQELQAAAETSNRFAEIAAFLSAMLAQADFVPPHEFFARLLGPLGGRAKLVARLGVDAHDPIDEFLNLALSFEQSEVVSLQGFLSWIALGGGEIKRDLEQTRNEVRIMTVHGAKGLESEIVIMPDTVRHLTAQTEDKLVRHEDGMVTWNVGGGLQADETQAARERLRNREDDEYRRLLYVAMTRAKDRLYIAGYKGARAAPETSWYEIVKRTLEPLADPAEVTFADSADPVTVLRIEAEQKVDAAEDERTFAEDVEVTLPDWIGAPAQPEKVLLGPVAPSHLSAGEYGEPPALSPLAGGGTARFKRGRLIHTLLQLLPEIAPEAREVAGLGFLERSAADLDGGERAEILAEVIRVLNDPQFAAVFAAGSRAEVPLAGYVTWRGERMALTGQVDRLAVADGRVLIIDFKTNRPPPADLEGVSPAYLDQMAAYRALAQQVYPDKPVDCALVWTDGARLMPLPSPMLDARLENHSNSLP